MELITGHWRHAVQDQEKIGARGLCWGSSSAFDQRSTCVGSNPGPELRSLPVFVEIFTISSGVRVVIAGIFSTTVFASSSCCERPNLRPDGFDEQRDRRPSVEIADLAVPHQPPEDCWNWGRGVSSPSGWSTPGKPLILRTLSGFVPQLFASRPIDSIEGDILHRNSLGRSTAGLRPRSCDWSLSRAEWLGKCGEAISAVLLPELLLGINEIEKRHVPTLEMAID